MYRIYKTYLCGSWGETLGIMALPLLVYGFYRVFSREEEEGCQKSWIPLTVGFTLLIQSHLLTGEMAGFFTILLCILFWKRVFRKKTFLVLAKTVVYSALLSAWFLVPFMDYMLTGDFVIQHVSERTIQDRVCIWPICCLPFSEEALLYILLTAVWRIRSLWGWVFL